MVDDMPQPDESAAPGAGRHRGRRAPPVSQVAAADPLAGWMPADLQPAADEDVAGLLRAADRRDAAAGDRDAEARLLSPEDRARLAGIYLEWAARDRDLAAGDRADLIALLRARNHCIPRQR